MKKKILIAIIVFLFLIVIICLNLSDNLVADNIIFSKIEYGKVYSQYNCLATVKGKEHYQFFNGVIKEIYYLPNDKIEKGQTILEYIDAYDKVIKLKSAYSGYIDDFTNTNVKITDKDLYFSVEVKKDIFNNIDENSFAIYKYDDKYYTTALIDKNDYGIDKDGQTFYLLKFKINEDTDFLLNQNVIIKISVNEQWGMVVDKRALLKKEGEYFLLEEGFATDYSHWEKYKIPIEVICCDDNNALISAIGIENINVYILDDFFKKVVQND